MLNFWLVGFSYLNIGCNKNIPTTMYQPTHPGPSTHTSEVCKTKEIHSPNQQEYDFAVVLRSSDIINLAIILKIGNDFQLFPGISDLKPDSNHIKQVISFLREETHDIPCRLVGSYVNNFGEMRNKNLIVSIASKLYPFQRAYAKIITKKEQGKHDGWLPLSTQLCRGESFEDLAIIGDSIQENNVFGKPHITAAIYKDMLHGPNITLI
ncbi:hypothetical protein [Candidatus Cardinium hertigii]|nr:hypothetical protein [Candidatus Cardinium hertigii]